MKVKPVNHLPIWPALDPRFLRNDLPEPRALPLKDILGPKLARWLIQAAEAKSAPADYVFAGLLSVCSTLIGNNRWVSPWSGWKEPPLIWCMIIGLPSAGKSPGLDALADPLRIAEAKLRADAAEQHVEWQRKKELANIAERVWKEKVKAAMADGTTPPPKPKEAEIGPEPILPRLMVNDATIEALAALLASRPEGVLQMRDELAGWLEGMVRYSKGSDRPFWIEAYGGRGWSVERKHQSPLTVDRLSIGILGGIQPDRLISLLLKSDDDGLLARLVPIWPHPAPIKRPQQQADDVFIANLIEKLLSLGMVEDKEGNSQPRLIPFAEPARERMDEFRIAVREWEKASEGLLVSFIGKLPGLAARLSLVFAYLDWAVEGTDEPWEISVTHFARAAKLIEEYILPMARRSYASASVSQVERSARHLVAIIREKGWRQFTSREVLRLERSGLGTKKELDPVLEVLVEGDCIRPKEDKTLSQGGRRSRIYEVNSALMEG